MPPGVKPTRIRLGVSAVLRKLWTVPRGAYANPPGPSGVHLVADPDLECAVEHVPELVLAGVDMRRRPAAGRGQDLQEHEASVGALAGRLERHRVTHDPDPFALAGGDGVPCGGE